MLRYDDVLISRCRYGVSYLLLESVGPQSGKSVRVIGVGYRPVSYVDEDKVAKTKSPKEEKSAGEKCGRMVEGWRGGAIRHFVLPSTFLDDVKRKWPPRRLLLAAEAVHSSRYIKSDSLPPAAVEACPWDRASDGILTLARHNLSPTLIQVLKTGLARRCAMGSLQEMVQKQGDLVRQLKSAKAGLDQVTTASRRPLRLILLSYSRTLPSNHTHTRTHAHTPHSTSSYLSSWRRRDREARGAYNFPSFLYEPLFRFSPCHRVKQVRRFLLDPNFCTTVAIFYLLFYNLLLYFCLPFYFFLSLYSPFKSIPPMPIVYIINLFFSFFFNSIGFPKTSHF
jgi:hypothetical protein